VLEATVLNGLDRQLSARAADVKAQNEIGIVVEDRKRIQVYAVGIVRRPEGTNFKSLHLDIDPDGPQRGGDDLVDLQLVRHQRRSRHPQRHPIGIGQFRQ
tara:strand:+ start:396 stop:695 length:300 start_codon:yes stop_codon:yes gene_type:complete